MTARLSFRRWVVPAYLATCLVLGGSSGQGASANLILQLLALPILVWVAMELTVTRSFAGARSLLLIAALTVSVMVVQLIPLPPAIWTLLPGRALIAQGFSDLGQPLPWLPLTLNPDGAWSSLYWLLPATAVLTGMAFLGAFRPRYIVWAIVGVTAEGVLIGALQIVGGNDSPWYFYPITNRGNAVGFFANANHAAILLVCAIPFLAALQIRDRKQSRARATALFVMTSAMLGVIAIGLATNLSLAGIGLAIPVTLASFMLIDARRGDRRLFLGIAVTALVGLAAVAIVFIGPFGNNLTGIIGDDPSGNAQISRSISIPKTLDAAVDFFPFGSGSGTFVEIYRTYENPSAVIRTYMNHAHSDAAQVLLELGLPGAVLMFMLVLWWARRAVQLWAAAEPDHYARAATIAAGALMAHSLVDYPLRMAGLAALFMACLALMAEVRPYAKAAKRSGARHLTA